MKRLIFGFVILLTSINFAQTAKIEIKNCNLSSIVINSVSGENLTPVDTITTKMPGIYSFTLSSKFKTGLYRINLAKNIWLDFIIDNENIEISTDLNGILQDIKVKESKSNELFYQFIKLNKDYKTKNELLHFILERYPPDDEYYKATIQRLNKLQDEYLYFINSVKAEMPDKFIAKYIWSSQLPIWGYDKNSELQIEYLKANGLNNVDFEDEILLNSDVFTNKAIEYLTYYRNPKMTKEQLEKVFETAVDSILIKAKVNNNVYHLLVEYLIKGFRDFGFDTIINYLLDNYVIKDDLCIDEKLETSLERRIQQAKEFKIGNKIPEIEAIDINGTTIKLSNINKDKIVIVFYASWCPHCQTLLPQINEYYKQNKNFEVLAISIDSEKEKWENFVVKNDLKFINVCDEKGWYSKPVLDYLVYATPTIFVVDKNKTVLGAPTDIKALIDLLTK